MPATIGNPDWRRRDAGSAVPIFVAAFPDDANRVSVVSDANGYKYIMVSVSNPGSLTYELISVNWFQDSAATKSLGTTRFTVGPNGFTVVKVPVITRYYTIGVGPVGGTAGHTTNVVGYGTNADQPNTLTQSTSVPAYRFAGTVAAGGTQTTIVPGWCGGEVLITNDDSVNNKWTGWLEYYDWTTQLWSQFWSVHGTDKGQTWNERLFAPYAPLRANIRNDDTVAHPMTQCLITP